MLLFLLLSFCFGSLSFIQPNICLNCKFILEEKNLSSGRCLLFPIVVKEDPIVKQKNMIDFLVTGYIPPPKKVEYHYCYDARERNELCGKEGTKYKSKSK
jgi:hypothetical protein